MVWQDSFEFHVRKQAEKRNTSEATAEQRSARAAYLTKRKQQAIHKKGKAKINRDQKYTDD